MRTDRLSTQRVILAVLILLLLGGGLLVGRHFDRTWALEHNPATLADPQAEPGVFRDWMWERHGLDLLVQVALVFAGTLGVAAILPSIGEGIGPAGPPTKG
jgi:hypothetical protein